MKLEGRTSATPMPTLKETLRDLKYLGGVPAWVMQRPLRDQLRWMKAECDAYDSWQRWGSD